MQIVHFVNTTLKYSQCSKTTTKLEFMRSNISIDVSNPIILFHKITDVTTGLRAFTKEVANLPTRARSLDYEAELTGRIISSGMKYAEVPIKTEQRFGMSKLHFFKSCWTFFIAVLRGAYYKKY